MKHFDNGAIAQLDGLKWSIENNYTSDISDQCHNNALIWIVMKYSFLTSPWNFFENHRMQSTCCFYYYSITKHSKRFVTKECKNISSCLSLIHNLYNTLFYKNWVLFNHRIVKIEYNTCSNYTSHSSETHWEGSSFKFCIIRVQK